MFTTRWLQVLFKVDQVVGGVHLEVGGEGAWLHPLLAASNIAVDLLEKKHDGNGNTNGNSDGNGNDGHKDALEHLPLLEGHQGLGELEQQILWVGGALRRRPTLPAPFAFHPLRRR